MAEMRRALLLIGPEPPPATGMEIATQVLCVELRRARIPVVRVNTADPRDVLGNRARWTLHNVALALRHLAGATRWSFSRNVGAVYVPIAQNFPALVRDLAFVMIAHIARKPVVLHLHGGSFGSFYGSQPELLKRVLRAIFGRAAIGLVLSDALRPELECVLRPDRVRAVPNGLDFAPSNSRSRSQSDNHVNVLFLSVLYRWKGILVFIRALAAAQKRFHSLRGTVAGPWPSEDVRAEALELADHLAVRDQLAFEGPVEGERKAELFSSADIFCFPSLVAEGQPLVVLEAMASRLPVVAPGWPGVAATVVDGETGLLVPRPDPEAIAQKLVYLAEHPAERERLGAAGAARYAQYYTQRAFGERAVAAMRPALEAGGISSGVA
jgi:glycosyltransferase involved in cell wall biosynthesis